MAASSPGQDPRYPIGQFIAPTSITQDHLRDAIHDIADMPQELREELRKLDQDQQNTPYREGGWTVRQLVHHLADSHTTAFFRLRKALTEDWPTVPGYDENKFAMLPDVVAPIEWSLEIVESVHGRWVLLLKSMSEEQFLRGIKHEERGPMAMDYMTLLYAWHSRHHVAHIRKLRQRQGW